MGSPVGKLIIRTDGGGRLVGIDFADPSVKSSSTVLLSVHQVVRQLREFFAAERQVFDVAFAFEEGTEFQQQVWREIARIPFGETITYGQLARTIGRPKAVRAVGAACGQNPISIVVPCHRVVGAGNKLTGYGGGLNRKAWLLEFERQHRFPAGN